MVLDGDVLTHLIDVEHEASLLILDAQKESDRRLAAARAKADSDFSEKFCKIQEELHAQKTSSENKIAEDYKNKFDQFKQDLESIPQNVQALNNVLESKFFNSNA